MFKQCNHVLFKHARVVRHLGGINPPQSYPHTIFSTTPDGSQRRHFRVEPNRRMSKTDLKDQVSLPKLFDLLRPHAGLLTMSSAAVLTSGLATLAIPTIFGQVIDILSDQTTAVDNMEQIYNLGYTFLGISVVGSAATYTRVSLLEILGEKVGAALRRELYANLLNQELAFYDQNKAGELANRLSTDVHEVAEHLVENVAVLLNATLMAAISSGFLVYTSPKLAMVTFAVVPAVSYGATLYSHRVKRLSAAHLNRLADATQIASERFSSIRTLKMYNAENYEMERYANKIDETFNIAKRLAKMEGVYVSSVFFVGNITLLMVIGMGTGMILEGTLTVGSLAAFCMYANELGDATSEITTGVAGVVRAQGAGSRLFALRDRKPHLLSGAVTPDQDVTGAIQLQDVHFAYPTRPDQPVLKGLSLSVAPGETLCVTGNSGCGKSTLSYLLTHLYDIQRGQITIDGKNVVDLSHSYLRRQVVAVTQHPVMFSGTILDNIAYGNQEVENPLERARECARIAKADQFIMKLPNQYDTEVGERGMTLSGGQMQRIVIARALFAQPRILVMDEATSALDIENELAVQRNIMEYNKDATLFIITHHLPVLKQADNVAIIQDGVVAEYGPYHALSEKGSPLLHLLENQAKVAESQS